MVDCLNHLWIKTDPVLRKYKRVPATRLKKSDTATTTTKNPDDILLESFIIEWNGVNWLLKWFAMNLRLNVFEICPISHQNSINISEKMGPIFEPEMIFVFKLW